MVREPAFRSSPVVSTSRRGAWDRDGLQVSATFPLKVPGSCGNDDSVIHILARTPHRGVLTTDASSRKALPFPPATTSAPYQARGGTSLVPRDRARLYTSALRRAMRAS